MIRASLLALLLLPALLLGQTGTPAPAPAPDEIAAESWKTLVPWQQEWVRAALKDPDWHKRHGIPDSNWTAFAPGERGRRILDELALESGRRLNNDLGPLAARANLLQNPSSSREDKRAFVRDFFEAQARNPGAKLPQASETARSQILTIAAIFQQEISYADAHPLQQAAVARVAEVRARSDAAAAGGTAGLDGLFNGAGVVGAAPSPGAVSRRPGTPPAAPAPPAIRTPGPRLPALKWRYGGPDPATDLISSPIPGRDPVKEEAWLREILGTLSVPVEKEVLAEAGIAQAAMRAERDRRAAQLRQRLTQLTTDLARTDLSPQVRARLVEEQKRHRENLAVTNAYSDELVVSFSTFTEAGVGAKVYWDQYAGRDGKRHMRMVFSRGILEAPVAENPKDAGRKIATHELTHVADLYRIMDPSKYPEQRFIEPRAFRNHALSYQQEGKPQGALVHRFGATDHSRLAADPINWMHDQLTRYVKEGGNEGGKGLWSNVTVDDVRDPAAALRWRLEYAYLNAVMDAPQLTGPPRREHLMKRAQVFQFDVATAQLMAAIDEDVSVPIPEKAAVFAGRAAGSAKAKEFLQTLRNFPKDKLAKLEREERAFFDSLAPIR